MIPPPAPTAFSRRMTGRRFVQAPEPCSRISPGFPIIQPTPEEEAAPVFASRLDGNYFRAAFCDYTFCFIGLPFAYTMELFHKDIPGVILHEKDAALPAS